jgi:hypothetical protein
MLKLVIFSVLVAVSMAGIIQHDQPDHHEISETTVPTMTTASPQNEEKEKPNSIVDYSEIDHLETVIRDKRNEGCRRVVKNTAYGAAGGAALGAIIGVLVPEVGLVYMTVAAALSGGFIGTVSSKGSYDSTC